jgi:fructose-1,6-bisphosphatase/inositol monophosphatase family enzyme
VDEALWLAGAGHFADAEACFMIRVDPDKVTKHIKEVAEAHILPYFCNLKAEHIAYKIGDDPVTIADKEAESALSKRLLELLPGSNVVGEEAFAGDSTILSRFSDESPVWIIDPVDGTRNFARGNPEFGVIVALAKQNQILMGWIYDPTSGDMITAERGSGAWFKGEKLKVLPPVPVGDMTINASPLIVEPYRKSRYYNELKPVFDAMTAGCHEYPRLVLQQPHFGKKDPLALHARATRIHTNPWDEAAGVLIHGEAGGYGARWNGGAYSLNILDQGLLLAPDRDSWNELKNWCASFCELPVG